MSDCCIPTSAEFKDNLRKKRLFFKELLTYLDNEDYDHIREKLVSNLEQVEQGLQD